MEGTAGIYFSSVQAAPEEGSHQEGGHEAVQGYQQAAVILDKHPDYFVIALHCLHLMDACQLHDYFEFEMFQKKREKSRKLTLLEFNFTIQGEYTLPYYNFFPIEYQLICLN